MTYYNAIIFFRDTENRRPQKYHNINNIEKFYQFVLTKKPGAIYFNLYFKKSKEFSHKVWIEENILPRPKKNYTNGYPDIFD
jgi:hypothetical protein